MVMDNNKFAYYGAFWTSTTEQLPPLNTPVLGFAEEWKDEDFNPNGIRECFVNGGYEWVSAYWFDHQDTYTNGEDCPPTEWMPLPGPPR